jgi:hypothetical protein
VVLQHSGYLLGGKGIDGDFGEASRLESGVIRGKHSQVTASQGIPQVSSLNGSAQKRKVSVGVYNLRDRLLGLGIVVIVITATSEKQGGG